MVKQDRAVRTRETVLAAAGAAFAENGFLGTSMADILQRAGVTKGALYFHFASKEELAFALIAEEEQAAARIVDEALARDTPPLHTLVALITRWAQSIQSDPVIRAGVRLIVEQGTYQRPMPEPYSQWDVRIAELLEKAGDRGELRKDVNCKAAAEFIVASFTGIQLLSQLTSGHQDLLERLQTMLDVVFGGLLADGHSMVFVPGAMV